MYKLHLILKYLLKRRIAWVSLLAVMLCTTMVLVVISVMGGWLNMFKNSFHGLSGDLIVKSNSLTGFPYYQEMIDRIEKDDAGQIEAAVPSIETFGLINIDNRYTIGVKVMGFPIERIGKVNRFPESLHLQSTEIVEKLKNPNLSADQRAALERELKGPPTFDLRDESKVAMGALPADVKPLPHDPESTRAETDAVLALPANAPKGLAGRLWYDRVRKNLVYKGRMPAEWKPVLQGISVDKEFQSAIASLYQQSQSPDIVPYRAILPDAPGDISLWPGMIPGAGVIGIRRNKEGEWEGRGPGLYELPVKLTVLGLANGGNVDMGKKAERNYWIVDDSRTQIWQYDNNFVYVPFDRLQADLGMDEESGTDTVTGKPVNLPARATEIHVRVKPGVDLDAARVKVQSVVRGVLAAHRGPNDFAFRSEPTVETWLESQAIWIHAIENEKLLVVFLFGIISVVAIFLIFCIFYMIVVEKTRDIGIIKSVGATSAGVASIFLGYGLVIGLLGSSLGLLISYLIVHNINEMHAWLGRQFGLQIWNPEVYLFDKIPNTMSGQDIAWIVPIAILASVLGALVPALRAASVNPVESLRWE
ncbi:MAG: Lipoprotein releasing system transrane protein LolC [Phycisphaerales bacterium]|nr:Lipoprotein releasing system transrane protein LolC [Phycisphaerales bacterium]